MRIRLRFALLSMIAALVLSSPALRAAETIPNQIADDAFWKLIDSASEEGGAFQSENFLSNETGFQAVIPALLQTTKPGGAYMGVGPEQNFTYISAIRPKIAFLIDMAIRGGLAETRPAAAGIELGIGFEQRLTAAGADVGA